MKIYQTKTQEDYDALMVELEKQGYTWGSGDYPTSENCWRPYKEKTCVKVLDDHIVFLERVEAENRYPGTPIIEYKAKGKENSMKIYHTATQGDYDALMAELEEKGCKWIDGTELSSYNAYPEYKKQTTFLVIEKKLHTLAQSFIEILILTLRFQNTKPKTKNNMTTSIRIITNLVTLKLETFLIKFSSMENLKRGKRLMFLTLLSIS